jgi:hypothetical protein
VDWNNHTPISSLKPTPAKLKREEEYFERTRREEKRMAKLIGDEFSFNVQVPKVEAYKERVRNDLGKKTYQVSIDEFEKWHKKGIRANDGEFDLENIPPEKQDWYKAQRERCALRK